MAFSHAYLVSLAQCWRGQRDKMRERSALWPPVLTWAWFLDPARVEPFGSTEALQILSVATLHAYNTNAPLWAKPIAIYREFQAGGSFELFTRLGEALDAHDEATCKAAGVELVEPRERKSRPLTTTEQIAATRQKHLQRRAAAEEREHVAAELGQADTDQAPPIASIVELVPDQAEAEGADQQGG